MGGTASRHDTQGRRMAIGRWRCAVVGWVLTLGMSFAGVAVAQPTGDASQRVATLVARLNEEARRLPLESLDRVAEGPAPTLLTPHPIARRSATRLVDADAPAVVEAIERLRGGDLATRYARFHLMGVLQGMLIRNDPLRDLDADTREAIGKLAVDAYTLDQPQEYLEGDFEDDRYREPRELFSEYRNLWLATTIEVGVPPFQQRLRGEAAIQAATPAQAQRIRAAMEQRAAMEARLSGWIDDEEASARNRRKHDLNDITRRTRIAAAELALASGHGPSIEKLLVAAAASARSNQLSGIDVVDTALRTIANGHAPVPDLTDADRRRLARALLRGADSGEPQRPREGSRALDHRRSFPRRPAELLGQLGGYIERPEWVAGLYRATPNDARSPNWRQPSRELSIDNVRAAIAQAQSSLHAEGSAWATMRQELPPLLFRESLDFGAVTERRTRSARQAVLAWGLVATGQPSQTSTLQRRVHSALVGDPNNTFSRAMRVVLASELPISLYEQAMRRDLRWVVETMTDQGGWGDEFPADSPWGDHASGQFALYALDAASRSGVSVPSKTWAAVDRHWRLTQQPTPGDAPAGWRVLADPEAEVVAPNTFGPGNGGIIATAGGVTALSVADRYLDSDEEQRREAINKGVAWLDRHLTSGDQLNSVVDWYFTMWAIQRVARSTGFSSFNDIDWFHDITPIILSRQNGRGYWSSATQGDEGLEIPTGAALLYLASVLDPIAVGRLEHDFGWDEEPAALTTFARYASDRYERDTISTSVRLDQPLDQMLDAPLLFIGATEPVQFTDAEVDKLRAYCQHGGLILLNPSESAGGVGRSFSQLLERLAPDRPVIDVEPDNPIYGVHRDVRPSIRMKAVGSAVRPWAIWLLKDIGQDLADTAGDNDAVSTLSNLYLYRVGRNPRRTRLATPYLAPADAPRTIAAARLRHDGDWNPEPAALDQLSSHAATSRGVALRTTAAAPSALSANTRLAFLTTAGDGTLTADQAADIRAWCEQGGTLVLDAAGGSAQAVNAAAAMLAAIFPDRSPLPLASGSPLIVGDGSETADQSSVAYRLFTLQRGVLTDRPRLAAVMLDGRPAVVFSPEDLTCGWAGAEHWGINGYTIDDARDLGANIVAAVAR